MNKASLIKQTHEVVWKYVIDDRHDLQFGDVVKDMLNIMLPHMTEEGMQELMNRYKMED